MVLNDCQWNTYPNFYMLKFLHDSVALGSIPAISISFTVGVLILIQKENRTRYPLSFIGYICLAQACSVWALRYGIANQCEFETVKIV